MRLNSKWYSLGNVTSLDLLNILVIGLIPIKDLYHPIGQLMNLVYKTSELLS